MLFGESISHINMMSRFMAVLCYWSTIQHF